MEWIASVEVEWIACGVEWIAGGGISCILHIRLYRGSSGLGRTERDNDSVISSVTLVLRSLPFPFHACCPCLLALYASIVSHAIASPPRLYAVSR